MKLHVQGKAFFCPVGHHTCFQRRRPRVTSALCVPPPGWVRRPRDGPGVSARARESCTSLTTAEKVELLRSEGGGLGRDGLENEKDRARGPGHQQGQSDGWRLTRKDVMTRKLQSCSQPSPNPNGFENAQEGEEGWLRVIGWKSRKDLSWVQDSVHGMR